MVITSSQDDVFLELKLEIQYVLNDIKAYEAYYRLTNVQDQIRSYVFYLLNFLCFQFFSIGVFYTQCSLNVV